MQLTEEGKARVLVHTGKISKKLPVFYNPLMKLNRDMSILLLRAIDKEDMQVASPLAGSGVREIRMLLELLPEKIRIIHANDYSEAAVDSIRKNIELNKIDTRIEVHQKDANIFLLEGLGFDYIDIDPFGSPNPFLDSAVQRLSRGGILAVTATDTSALTGTYPQATMRKYHSFSMRNEFMHETGIRILIRHVQMTAAEHEKALTPIFSYSKDHYFRIFFSCEKGRTRVDKLLEQHGYILYCRKCLDRRIAKGIFNDKRCVCGQGYEYAGLLWLGQLWDSDLIRKMLADSEEHLSFLSTILEESDVPSVGFYNVSWLARSIKLQSLPRIEMIIEKLKAQGHKASRTHFDGEGIRASSFDLEAFKELI